MNQNDVRITLKSMKSTFENSTTEQKKTKYNFVLKPVCIRSVSEIITPIVRRALVS